MVLNGTLHEFILADILQLLSQQKATGKLVFTASQHTGFIALKDGAIVAAEDDQESLQQKLANCLMTMKRIPESIVKTLQISTRSNLASATAELVQRQYLSKAEVIALAQAVFEDFVCSLCSWRSGDYRFESLDRVDEYIIPTVSLSADYIVMEAMRRTDESKTIHTQLSDDTIFVQAVQTPISYPSDVVALLNDPQQYAFYFVDGLSTVALLAQRTCLTRYRLYEILHGLWQKDLITPLSSKLSRSIQAALIRKHGEGNSSSASLVRALTLTAAIIIAVIIIGAFVHLDPGANHKPTDALASPAQQLQYQQSIQKIKAAIAEYRLQTNKTPTSLKDLIKPGLLHQSDIAQIPAGTISNLLPTP